MKAVAHGPGNFITPPPYGAFHATFSKRETPPTNARFGACRDIFEGIAAMDVELEPEVERWIDALREVHYAIVLVQVDRLDRMGSAIREPWSKPLGAGLFELRFDLDTVAWRVTYFFSPNRKAVLLTAFRKQRNNERQEVTRAKQAMHRCIAEHEHDRS
jgi:hypothetical protein